jgi:AraC-like DNA-binding protein/mannose-6-phosphate isomerase-like protein (cupin superfamily)
MSLPEKNEVAILTKEDFFRPDENIHIQMSNEFPDYIGVLHKHKYIEVVYIVSGNATHLIAGKTYKVKRGDLFIVNMDTPHVFYEDKSSREPFVAYDLMFTPEFFDSDIRGDNAIETLHKSFMFRSLFVGREDFPPFYSVSASAHIMFGELFNKIYLEHRRCEKGYLEIIRAYLLQLIITIFRLDDESVKNSDNLRSRQIVDFVTDYIKNNYKSRLSLATLAKLVYLSPDYLGRIYKNATNLTVGDMIQRVRIEAACDLLLKTSLNVADIAAECGFDDVKFFYSVFKKRINSLPSQYRKQYLEK